MSDERDLEVAARELRARAALQLRRDKELSGLAALVLVVAPPEAVYQASLRAAEGKRPRFHRVKSERVRQPGSLGEFVRGALSA